MKTHVKVTTSLAALVVASLVAASPAAAQYRVHTGYEPQAEEPNGPSLTPYFGYMSFAKYEFGQLGSSSGSGSGSVIGLQFMLPLSEHFAILGNGAHANTNLSFMMPVGGGPTVGSTGVWMKSKRAA